MPACETRLLTVSLPIGSGNKWFLSAKELLKEPADLYCGMATMTEAHYGLGNKAHFERNSQGRFLQSHGWIPRVSRLQNRTPYSRRALRAGINGRPLAPRRFPVTPGTLHARHFGIHLLIMLSIRASMYRAPGRNSSPLDFSFRSSMRSRRD